MKLCFANSKTHQRLVINIENFPHLFEYYDSDNFFFFEKSFQIKFIALLSKNNEHANDGMVHFLDIDY